MRTVFDANNQDDVLYESDIGNRYLGHDKATYGFIVSSPLFPGTGTKEFIFPLNPQSIEQDEESAVVITPTQGGGKFIENQGNIFKDIVISGNTGFLPLRNFRDVQGPALFQKATQTLSTGTSTAAQDAFARVSGYNTFHTLRSLWREYQQIHRTGSIDVRRQTQFFWLNLKDNETWLVEPMSFRASRASRSPMTYNYNIRLRTIAKAAATFTAPKGTPSTLLSSVVSGARKTLTGIRDRIDAAKTLLNSALKVFDQYRALRSLAVSIFDVATDLSASLTKIAAGTADVIDLPRSIITAASANITNLFVGILDSADLVAAAPLDAYESLTTLKQQFDFVKAKTDLFDDKWSTAWNNAIANYNATYGINGDVTSSLNESTSRNGLSEATPTKGDNVYTFAARVTGDATRAAEIIVLNNLQWPYFSPSADERAPGTVAPGDVVLVPTDLATNSNDNYVTNTVGSGDRTFKDEVNGSSSTTVTKTGLDLWRTNEWVGYSVEVLSGAGVGQKRLITANTTTTLTVSPAWTTVPSSTDLFRIFFNRVTVAQRGGITELLGVDLRVREDQNTHKWDLVEGSDGDFSLIRGTDNLNQALTIKFISTQGDLILHQWFGLKPVFGQRGTPAALLRLRLYFEQTLLSDTRIESIKSLAVSQVGDKYTTTAKLAVKGGLRSRFSSPLV